MRPGPLPRSSALPCAPARFHGPRPHFHAPDPASTTSGSLPYAPDPLPRSSALPCARPCFHGLQRFHAPGPLPRSSAFPCARPASTVFSVFMRPARFHGPRPHFHAPGPASTVFSVSMRPGPFPRPRPHFFMRPGPLSRPPAHSLRPPVKKMLKIYSVRASPSPLCAFFSLDNASGSPRSIRFSKS